MRKKRYTRKERGVALLFALGILSLLLVVSLAFVANSLLANKVAVNNSSRSQANIVARGAINRIAGAVMLYQVRLGLYTAANDGDAGEDDILFSDLANVVSYYERTGVVNNDGTAGNVSEDQLDQLLPAYQRIILQPLTQEETIRNNTSNGYYDEKFYDLEKAGGTGNDEKRRPHWIFIDNGETGNDRRLVGRYAYRVLPPRSNSRINLNRFLKARPTPGSSDPLFVDISEIDLTETPLSFWSPGTADADHLADSTDLFIKAWKSKFPATLASAVNVSEREVALWLKRWFDDGVSQGDLEVFESALEAPAPSTDKLRRFYHRFNLRRNDWDNFLNKGANSDAAVAALMGEAHEFRNSTGNIDSNDDFDITDPDANSPLNSGLEYLNIIGDSTGSFRSHEARRKQIAANLLDYCDTNSVPTSDVDANTWKNILINPHGDWPKYTGNEKTPYINEVAIGYGIEMELTEGTGDFNQEKIAVNCKLTPELIAELIDIYGVSVGGSPVSPGRYKFLASLKELKIKMRLSVEGNVRYSYDDSGNTAYSTVPFDNSLKKLITQEFVSAPVDSATPPNTEPIVVTVDFSSATWQNGYLVCAVNLVSKEQKFDFTPLAEDTFNNASGSSKAVVKAYLTQIKAEIVEAKLEFGAMTLADTANSDCGVDFVCWEDAAGAAGVLPIGSNAPTDTSAFLLFSTLNSGIIETSASDTSYGDITIDERYRRFYIGGMEVIDPRQNLLVRPDSGTSLPSDWSKFDGVRLTDYDNPVHTDFTDPRRVISMNIDPVGTTVPTRLKEGRINRDGNPKKGTANASPPPAFNYDNDCDQEVATDPAWKGDDRIQHLSTAYIRNDRMLSPWELGAIHRGYRWQTIKLSSANNFVPEDHKVYTVNTAGISYQDGDGAILDQVKMSDKARSWGKLDLNMFRSSSLVAGGDNSLDASLLRAILKEVPLDTFYDSNRNQDSVAAAIRTDMEAACLAPITNLLAAGHMDARSKGIQYFDITGTVFDMTKAERDEIASKVMNLMKAGPGLVTTFQAAIVAQSIQDVGRVASAAANSSPIRRIKPDGTLSNPHDAVYGVFDYSSGDDVYFDQITGEVRLLVTFDRNPATGKIKVRSVEYLDGDDYNLLP